MIFTWVLGVFFGFISWIFGLFPSFTGPDTSGWSTTAGSVGNGLHSVTYWVDVPLLVNLLGLLAASLVVYGVVKGVLWVLSHIPFFGTGED